MPNPSEPCIFCRRIGGKSKEHILGKWLEQVFPRSATDNYHQINATDVKDFRPIGTIDIRHRQGRIHTLTKRLVCKACNNGWLSVIQENAKPVLMPLIRGEPFQIDEKSARSLCVWAVRASMLLQYTDNPGLLGQDERRLFFETKNPSSCWQVGIGRYGSSGAAANDEEFVAYNGGSLFPTLPNQQIKHALFTTTIVLGKILILTIFYDLAEFQFQFDRVGIRRITGSHLSYPICLPEKPIDRPALEKISRKSATESENWCPPLKAKLRIA